jgi:Matrixin.
VVFHEVPIRVVADLEVYDETKLAVDLWNDELGFTLLSTHVVTDPVVPDVYVLDLTSRVDAFGALADASMRTKLHNGKQVRPPIKVESPEARRLGGRDYVGQVRVWFGGDTANVMVHEIGHILGLAHDRLNMRSIMYPSASWVMPIIEPADLAILRARYAGCR